MGQVISEFYGMTILMSLDASDSKPHIEILYEGKISKLDLSTGRFYSGDLIEDGREIVVEWYQRNRHQLFKNWDMLQQNRTPQPIPAIL